MLTSLRELTDNPEKRPGLIADCVELIDQQVKSKRGLGGMAVKAAYGLVKTFKPRMMESAVDSLLDDFADVLQTHYQHWREEGGGNTLEQYMGARSADIAEGLLQVTDGRADQSSKGTVVKAYYKLRPKAKVHVEQAVPDLGRLLDRHVASFG